MNRLLQLLMIAMLGTLANIVYAQTFNRHHFPICVSPPHLLDSAKWPNQNYTFAPFTRSQFSLKGHDDSRFGDTTQQNASANRDSSRNTYRPTPAVVGIQAIAAGVGFSLPFWGLGYRLRNKDKQFWISPSSIIGFFTAPLCTIVATDLIHSNDGNVEIGFLAGAGGALLASALLEPVYHIQADESIPHLFALDVICSVAFSVLSYDLTMWLQ